MTQTIRRTDQELKTTVNEELHYLPSIDATHVDVQVSNGSVTLSGEVASLPERRDAKNAAMRIDGIKNVTDEMTVRAPAGSGPSDEDIAAAAGQFLAWTVDVPANAIQADVKDHKLTLSGHVTWAFQRDAAARAVTFIKGVTRVENRIALTQPAPTADTKASVEAAMRRQADLNSATVTVDVNGPELALRGSVRSLSERRLAERAAWSAPGVTVVRNELHVAS